MLHNLQGFLFNVILRNQILFVRKLIYFAQNISFYIVYLLFADGATEVTIRFSYLKMEFSNEGNATDYAFLMS